MKKLIIGVIFITFSLMGYSSGVLKLPLPIPDIPKFWEMNKALQIRDSTIVQVRDSLRRSAIRDSINELKGRMVMAIILQESNNNTKAIDHLKTSFGNMQITAVCIKEANRLLGYKKYKLADVFNPKRSLEIFWIIQKQYNPTFDFEKACRVWNGGPNGMTKKSTLKYWAGVREKFKSLCNGTYQIWDRVNKKYQTLNTIGYGNLVIEKSPQFFYERG